MKDVRDIGARRYGDSAVGVHYPVRMFPKAAHQRVLEDPDCMHTVRVGWWEGVRLYARNFDFPELSTRPQMFAMERL